jgi:ribulose-phosphate 3-epimerase
MAHIPIIAPSILAANFRNLEKEFEKINASTAQWIHFDIMDGIFVPNISFGFPILEAVSSLTSKYIDVHLMIAKPASYFEQLKKNGAHGVTIHFEGNRNLKEELTTIQELGMQAGLVINPDTPLDSVIPYLDYIDLWLIMSVFPGFGGQKFIPATIDRVSQAKKMIAQSHTNILLQVDGGVTIENSRQLLLAGADVLVSGSALFQAPNFNDYIFELGRKQ